MSGEGNPSGPSSFTVTYHDARPDALGRRHFTLNWTDDGRRRGQVFFAVPERFVPDGATVIDGAEEAGGCE